MMCEPTSPAGPRHDCQDAFTVIVPAFGRPRTTARVLARLAQLHVPTIIVDDGSEPALDLAAATSPWVTLIRQRHAGAAAARNRGADTCKTPWIVFSDNDALWTERTVARLRHLVRTTPPRTWVIGALRYPASESSLWTQFVRRQSAMTPRDTSPSRSCGLSTGLCLKRRDELFNLGGFLTGCHDIEDMELGVRAASSGISIVGERETWTAINLDLPCTLARSVARHRQYLAGHRAFHARWPERRDVPLVSAPGPTLRWRRVAVALLGRRGVEFVSRVGQLSIPLRVVPFMGVVFRFAFSAGIRQAMEDLEQGILHDREWPYSHASASVESGRTGAERDSAS